ncbi:fluoride efflux transporter CrcB [Streptomyces lunaelactis]|uniref:fluoride efflux transporter CrcB n=1 Tax=Streptomyces lunaelactis TaxID=1535768 RepID=UPI001585B35E|nr:fluoride efflux transporter CrcB [Streptomyces lunaelactis]NUK51647.1 fluoride efflux transporter CrcB [Streptomyces lunaelactis]NUK69180.1 fluoride efflux transporter CrcB [Streptomyces lunaelactis]NUK75692.1 fluoride efflux transporter CrcB [Streptomyces lunaelactis]NUK80121.1 fluoride efflux transporter CrcB [Streptomyces lunaelactis]
MTSPGVPEPAEAIDPDVDLHVPGQRAETAGHGKWWVLSAISVGGVAGALARYAASLLWPAAEGAFPWATFWVNVVGCALIGVLMVLVSEHGRPAHPLVRPFLGAGVLGGFTTFSTYARDFTELLEREEAGTAMAYAAGTPACALGAVWLAASVTRWAVSRPAVAR